MAQANQESTLNWRKSSACGSGADCVEVANFEPYVLVRDSHNKTGTVLKVTAGTWLRLLSCIKNGELFRGRV